MDVIDLTDFYASALGQVAKGVIGRQISQFWPDLRNYRLVGFGYATPYLSPYLTQAERVIGLMPASQGVIHWPENNARLTALVSETNFPLPDASIDRMLLMHCVETSEELRLMLREVWRVLSPAGRLLIVVPNRRGLWARRESTPFGQGRPWSRHQVIHLLHESMFAPTRWANALSVPPVRWRIILRSAMALEKLGQNYFPSFSGVVMVEAEKQIYAATGKGVVSRERSLGTARAGMGVQAQMRETSNKK